MLRRYSLALFAALVLVACDSDGSVDGREVAPGEFAVEVSDETARTVRGRAEYSDFPPSGGGVPQLVLRLTDSEHSDVYVSLGGNYYGHPEPRSFRIEPSPTDDPERVSLFYTGHEGSAGFSYGVGGTLTITEIRDGQMRGRFTADLTRRPHDGVPVVGEISGEFVALRVE